MEVDSPVKGKPTTMSNDDVDFAAALVQVRYSFSIYLHQD